MTEKAPVADVAVQDLVRRGREKRLLFDAAGYEEAVPLLREALELDPASAEAYAELSQTCAYWAFRREICGQQFEGLYEMAYDYADMALRLAPDLARAHTAMAVALRRGPKADPERRRKEALLASELDPSDAEALCELWRADGYDPDDPALRRTLEAGPGLVSVHIDLGAVLCELGRFEEALAELQKALRINPRNVQAYYDAAMVLDRQGHGERAAALLRKAGELSPDDPLIAQGLSILEDGERP